MDTHRLDSAILLLKKNEEWARRTNHDEFHRIGDLERIISKACLLYTSRCV